MHNLYLLGFAWFLPERYCNCCARLNYFTSYYLVFILLRHFIGSGEKHISSIMCEYFFNYNPFVFKSNDYITVLWVMLFSVFIILNKSFIKAEFDTIGNLKEVSNLWWSYFAKLNFLTKLPIFHLEMLFVGVLNNVIKLKDCKGMRKKIKTRNLRS